MSIFTDIAGVIGSVAPTIASALGGPLAGTAIGAISHALGMPDAAPDAVQAIVTKATPEQLLAIKQAEEEFALSMRKLDIDVLTIQAGDRASARQREVAVRDVTPAVLALALTVGFFGLLGWMMYQAPPTGSRDILNVMLGSLGTGWITMLSYYYGASATAPALPDLGKK